MQEGPAQTQTTQTQVVVVQNPNGSTVTMVISKQMDMVVILNRIVVNNVMIATALNKSAQFTSVLTLSNGIIHLTTEFRPFFFANFFANLFALCWIKLALYHSVKCYSYRANSPTHTQIHHYFLVITIWMYSYMYCHKKTN